MGARVRSGPDFNGVQIIDVLEWTEAFARQPFVTAVDAASVAIRLEATPAARFWKDWMAKLVADVVAPSRS
jgi:hypothetical protein